MSTKKENLYFPPKEISGTILTHLKKIAEDYLEEGIEDAVITVPAYFTDIQRQATKDAGKLAGLNVTRILNEPTAAAMAYGLQEAAMKKDSMKVLVYNLGGGTFDVSVLEMEDDFLHVKSTNGNTDLGGEDFNALLIQHFKKEIFHKYGKDINLNHKANQRLYKACKILKEIFLRKTLQRLHLNLILSCQMVRNFHLQCPKLNLRTLVVSSLEKL